MISHTGYRARLVIEQLVSVSVHSPDPREGRDAQTITHREHTVDLSPEQFGKVLADDGLPGRLERLTKSWAAD